MASAVLISAGWIARSRVMRAGPLWILSSSLLWLDLAGPVCAEGDGGGSPSPPAVSRVQLCPEGDAGPQSPPRAA